MWKLPKIREYKPSQSGLTEDPEKYRPGGLHPILIGDTLKDGRYRIVHKLGFGSFSTAWLAKDQQLNRYVGIKIAWASASPESQELQILREVAATKSDHLGRDFVMHLLDDFIADGPNGKHICYVTEIAGQRLGRRAGVIVGNLDQSRFAALQLAQALDFLHSRKIAHGDLYTSNILNQIRSLNDWSDDDIYECLGQPSKEEVQKILPGEIGPNVPKYTVKAGNLAALEEKMMVDKILIIDFGQAFYHGQKPNKMTTPTQFSAPEDLYAGSATSAVDKWSFGCTTFELCSGYSLLKMIFHPMNDVRKDMVSMLGKPPDLLWNCWEEREKYFEPDGTPKKAVGRQIPVKMYPLRQRVFDLANQQAGGYHPEEKHPIDLVNLFDLLGKLMVYEPESRISFDDVQKHSFFRDLVPSSL